MAPKKPAQKKTREGLLMIKRLAEKQRYGKIKNDPIKLQQQKEKERLKYLK